MSRSEGLVEPSAERLIDLVPTTARDVLYLWCGEGTVGAALKARAKEAGQRCTVAGVEPDPERAAAARDRLDSVAIANPIRVALPYAPRSFDVVIADGTFDAVDDPPRLAKLVFQWLKPKGRLVALCADPPLLEEVLVGSGFRLVDEDHGSWPGLIVVARPAEPLLHRPVRSLSFVTVVTNHAETTGFLKVIADARQDAPFEIIVVDDASVDQTSTMEGTDDGSVIFLHNPVPMGLVGSVAVGTRVAHSKALAFLDPGLSVGSGFSRKVDRLLAEDRSIGALAPLVLAPDGTVESAGYDVDVREGRSALSPAHRGEGFLTDGVKKPRPIGYLDPAACVIRRTAYEMVGGFDTTVGPEEAGTAMVAALVEADWRVVYEPGLRLVRRS